MIVYVDIHGVLANLADAIVYEYNLQHGTKWTHSDIKNWDWSPVIQPHQNWLDYTKKPFFWDNLPLYPWAKDLINTIKSAGHICAFLSDVPYGVENEHRIWLDKHFGSDASKHLIIAKRKDLVVCHKGCVAIEDGPENINAIRALGGKVYPLAQPWNANIKGCYTPTEIISKIGVVNYG
jgi:5'(3')-deoxyribonucleotidase